MSFISNFQSGGGSCGAAHQTFSRPAKAFSPSRALFVGQPLRMRFLKKTIIVLGILYLVIAAALWYAQESLIFHPRPRAAEYSYGNYPETYIDVSDEVRLHAITVEANPGQSSEKVVMYLHGNVGDNGRSLHQTRNITGLGADLFLVDYRGYGKSEGAIGGEENMTDDLQAAYDYLKTRYEERNIVIAGYSLGTGPASFLAANNDPRGIVLVAPYLSLTDMKNEFFWMFPDFILTYSLNSLANLAKSTCPVTILHGTNDELIPFSMGQTLEQVDDERIELVPLDGVGHRGAIFHPDFSNSVAAMLRTD